MVSYYLEIRNKYHKAKLINQFRKYYKVLQYSSHKQCHHYSPNHRNCQRKQHLRAFGTTCKPELRESWAIQGRTRIEKRVNEGIDNYILLIRSNIWHLAKTSLVTINHQPTYFLIRDFILITKPRVRNDLPVCGRRALQSDVKITTYRKCYSVLTFFYS